MINGKLWVILVELALLWACSSTVSPDNHAEITDSSSSTTSQSSSSFTVPVGGYQVCEVYDRNEWNHWIDADGDCQNTRQEVLNATNQLGTSTNCTISTGLWIDPYTGNQYTLASDLDIDHMVPLAEAYESGAYLWDSATKQAYANDLSYPEHLRVMKDSENQAKGKSDPSEWLPDSSSYWKQYVLDWIKVKVRWNLTADSAELAKIKEVLGADTSLVEKFPVEAPETWCTGYDKSGVSVCTYHLILKTCSHTKTIL